MIRYEDYDKILKKYFVLEDTKTRKIMLAIDEADQNNILSSLTSKLYDNIVNKVDDIDYGDIPKTKGDITKLPDFDKLVECLSTMKGIITEYKQPTKPIDIIEEALQNIMSRKSLFEKAFLYNVELPMITYSTICLSIISSISFMISTCIDFIKLPTQESFEITLNQVALGKTKSNLLFTNLDKFNEACKKGQVDQCMDFVIKNNVKNLTGVEVGVVVGSVALVGLLLNIVPILRELIFFFYYSRVRVSDYFDTQADLLQMNAYNVKLNDTMAKKDKESISKKQMKIVDMFRKISNKIAVNGKECDVKATKELVTSNKQYKTDELIDSAPDSASSVLF